MCKMKLLFFIIGLLLISLLDKHIVAQDTWRGIIPLKTTKSEVENKIGKPNDSGFYELEEGKVFIKYVETKCENLVSCECLVPINTVMFVKLQINYDLTVKELDLNKNEFKKTPSSFHPDIITYTNKKTGVSYETSEGEVYTIYYYGSATVCNEISEKYKNDDLICYVVFDEKTTFCAGL